MVGCVRAGKVSNAVKGQRAPSSCLTRSERKMEAKPKQHVESTRTSPVQLWLNSVRANHESLV
jgi:hypothetical protein